MAIEVIQQVSLIGTQDFEVEVNITQLFKEVGYKMQRLVTKKNRRKIRPDDYIEVRNDLDQILYSLRGTLGLDSVREFYYAINDLVALVVNCEFTTAYQSYLEVSRPQPTVLEPFEELEPPILYD